MGGTKAAGASSERTRLKRVRADGIEGEEGAVGGGDGDGRLA